MYEPVSLPGGHDSLQTALNMAAFVLPALGIIVVIFALIALASPFGSRLREKTQRFKGLGIELEMSVLAMVLLLGVVLCFAGIYIASRNYETRLAELAEYPSRLANLERAYKQVDQTYRQAIADARRLTITALVNLEGVSTSSTDPPKELKCHAHLFNSPKPIAVPVEGGFRTNQFKVVLEDVSSTTPFVGMVCSDKGGRRWILGDFSPLSPEYHLKREP